MIMIFSDDGMVFQCMPVLAIEKDGEDKPRPTVNTTNMKSPVSYVNLRTLWPTDVFVSIFSLLERSTMRTKT